MKKRPPALIPFLVFISVVFIGILIYVYFETKKANPQMIEVGQASSAPARLVVGAAKRSRGEDLLISASGRLRAEFPVA